MKSPSRRHLVAAIQITSIAFSCFVWELASRIGWLDAAVMPSCLDTAREIGALLTNSEFTSEAIVTLARVALAFGIALPVALGLGWLGSRPSPIGRLIERIVNFLMTIPQSIFLPLFMLVLGVGTLQKVAFGATHVIFFVAVIVVAAIRSIPRSYATAARSFGASPAQIAVQIYVPAVFPSLVGGLRIGFLYGALGVLLAEMYGSRHGIGVLLSRWQEEGDATRLNAALLIVSAVTILVSVLLRRLEGKFSHWTNA